MSEHVWQLIQDGKEFKFLHSYKRSVKRFREVCRHYIVINWLLGEHSTEMSSLGGLDGYESSSSSDSEGNNQDDIGKSKNDSDVNSQPEKYIKVSSTEKQSQPAQNVTIPKPFEEKHILPPKFTSSLKRVRVDESSCNIPVKRRNSNNQTNLLPPQLRGRPNVCTEDVEQFGVTEKKEKK